MNTIEFKDPKIEWYNAETDIPEKGVVMGLTKKSGDVAVPVTYVPLLGWFQVEDNGRYLHAEEVIFWSFYNLPK
jgi:hypothetical protein